MDVKLLSKPYRKDEFADALRKLLTASEEALVWKVQVVRDRRLFRQNGADFDEGPPRRFFDGYLASMKFPSTGGALSSSSID